MRTVIRRLAIVSGAALVALALLLFWLTTDPVDRCLDRGGRWDAQASRCVTE